MPRQREAGYVRSRFGGSDPPKALLTCDFPNGTDMFKRFHMASAALLSVLVLSAVAASGQPGIDWPKQQASTVASASDGGIDWP